MIKPKVDQFNIRLSSNCGAFSFKLDYIFCYKFQHKKTSRIDYIVSLAEVITTPDAERKPLACCLGEVFMRTRRGRKQDKLDLSRWETRSSISAEKQALPHPESKKCSSQMCRNSPLQHIETHPHRALNTSCEAAQRHRDENAGAGHPSVT